MTWMSPSYVHESWYLMFILALIMSLLVLWAGIVLDAVHHGTKPRDVGLLGGVPAVLGILIATTPYGLALWCGLTLAFISEPGVPFGPVAFPVLALATLSLFFYWERLIGPTVRSVVRQQRPAH